MTSKNSILLKSLKMTFDGADMISQRETRSLVKRNEYFESVPKL